VDLNALPAGYQLLWYKIEATIGQGGFGITYRANDTNLNQTVAVKEFYPSDLASRTSDSNVHPSSSRNIDDFSWGLSRFTQEAQTLAKFRHPNIVRVYSVFEANQTAYMVMEYIEGRSVSQAIRAGLLEDEDTCLKLLFGLMDGLQLIHDSGFIHRDIKPDNICLTEDGVPVLLDFGSARQALGSKTHALTSVVSPGYAPFEQYSTQADGRKQGPWTDIYSLAATIYHVIAKRGPLDVLDRVNAVMAGNKDPLVPASEMGRSSYSPAFLGAIDRALAVQSQDRPQSLDEWKQFLPVPEMESDKTVLRPAARTPRRSTAPPVAQPSETPAKKRRWLWPSVGALSVVLLIGIGVAIFPGGEIESEIPKSLFEKTEQKEQQATIARLLADAETDAREGRLSRPAGRNALDRYREVLKIEPDNEAAKEGIELVMGRYAEAAEEALAEERFEQAEQNLDTAADILPDAPVVWDIRQRLAQAREAAEMRQHDEAIQRELAAADRDFRAGRLDSPRGGNALERYRKVLVLEPDNAAATQGLERIMTHYVALADAALGNKDFAKVAQHLEAAAEVLPAGAALTMARRRLANAQQAASREAEAQRKRQEDIRRELAAAEQDLEADRLSMPKGRNALERYRKVLVLEPDNEAALQGLREIMTRYVELADRAMSRRDFDKVEDLLDKANRVLPGVEIISSTRRELAAAKKALESERNLPRQAPAPPEDPTPARSPPAPRVPLRVAVLPFAWGGSSYTTSTDPERDLRDFAHEFLRSNHDLVLSYSYYAPGTGLRVDANSASLWSGGFVDKVPVEGKIYDLGKELDIDAALTYFFKLQGVWVSGRYDVDVYLFDIDRRKSRHTRADQDSYRSATERLFSSLLRASPESVPEARAGNLSTAGSSGTLRREPAPGPLPGR
jgi:serine/threonine protein kinase